MQKHISYIAEKHTAVLTPELFGLQWHHSSKWYSKESMGYTKHFPRNRFKLVRGGEKDGAGLTPGETHWQWEWRWRQRPKHQMFYKKHPCNVKVTTYWHPNIFITARAKTPIIFPGVHCTHASLLNTRAPSECGASETARRCTQQGQTCLVVPSPGTKGHLSAWGDSFHGCAAVNYPQHS